MLRVVFKETGLFLLRFGLLPANGLVDHFAHPMIPPVGAVEPAVTPTQRRWRSSREPQWKLELVVVHVNSTSCHKPNREAIHGFHRQRSGMCKSRRWRLQG